MDQRQGLSKPSLILLTAASIVVIIAGIRAASDILSPLLMAAFLAIISTPPIVWLQSQGLPKLASYAIVIAFFSILLLLSISGISSSIDQISATLPFYESRLDTITSSVGNWLHNWGILPDSDAINSLIDPRRVIGLMAYLVNPAGDLLANVFLIVLAMLFMLGEAGVMKNKLYFLLSEKHLSFSNLEGFTRTVNRYFLIKTVMSLVTGLFISIWLMMLGVDFAILWGWLAFFMNFVPYIGSIIAAIPAVLLALLGQGPELALYAAGGFLMTNMVVGNVLEPRFLGKGLGLSTLVVFISMVFWGWVLGAVGMFLSAPLTMLVKIAVESDAKSRWVGVLLGTGAELSKEKRSK